MIRLLYWFFGILTFFGLVGISAAAYIFWHFSQDLPDHKQLQNYQPPVTSRIHASDGQVVSEFATQKRIFVPIEVVPKRVIQAFTSAEDKNFYHHPGIDFFGMFRAFITNINNYRQGKRLQGASTITQQVATNFLLQRDQTLRYKVRQIFLSFVIERAFTKDEILELYLNEIYFGSVYGVAAAAMHYFDKSLDELEIEEAAYLAALPKGPNNYHPVRHYDRAIERRNWVIERMQKSGYISLDQMKMAQSKPLITAKQKIHEAQDSEYFVEEVRRQIIDKYNFKGLYEGGLTVRTSLDLKYQKVATSALKKGLEAYDKRHGWRGPQGYFEVPEIPRRNEHKKLGELSPHIFQEWQKAPALTAQDVFKMIPQNTSLWPWQESLVLHVDQSQAYIGLKDGEIGVIPIKNLKWARQWISQTQLGPWISDCRQVLQVGDVVYTKLDKITQGSYSQYSLEQLPKVQGAIVAIDPHTGRVKAATGGYNFEESEFNRVTQAYRQPGSAFKPFAYLAALIEGYAPNSLILDAPFIVEQGPGLPLWRPKNYSGEFYGPTPLHVGLEKSRNLMTVRLANIIGMDKIKTVAEKFDIYDDLPPHLSMVLGAGETTLLRLTTAYSMFVNGGKKVSPIFIDRIQDRYGKTIFRQDQRPCTDCQNVEFNELQDRPELVDIREQVIDDRHAFQMVTLLEGVVQRGTGIRARSLNRPIAGKTGTTNESRDGWFIGFTPDLVVGVYVGFDEPLSLGKKEDGSRVALPIFKSFMGTILEDQQKNHFRVPNGLVFADVDGIRFPFIPGTEPGSGNALQDVWGDEFNGPIKDGHEKTIDENQPIGIY